MKQLCECEFDMTKASIDLLVATKAIQAAKEILIFFFFMYFLTALDEGWAICYDPKAVC